MKYNLGKIICRQKQKHISLGQKEYIIATTKAHAILRLFWVQFLRNFLTTTVLTSVRRWQKNSTVWVLRNEFDDESMFSSTSSDNIKRHFVRSVFRHILVTILLLSYQ